MPVNEVGGVGQYESDGLYCMEKGDTLPFCTMRLKVSVMPSIVWWWFERRDAQDQTSEIRVLRDRDNPYLIFTPCGADPSKVRVWSSLNNWIFFFLFTVGTADSTLTRMTYSRQILCTGTTAGRSHLEDSTSHHSAGEQRNISPRPWTFET